MSLPATESFTGASGALADPPWHAFTQTVDRDGSGLGQLHVAGGADNIATWSTSTDVFPNDQYSQVVAQTTLGGGGTNYLYLVARASGTSGSGSWYWFWTDGGSDTQLLVTTTGSGGVSSLATANATTCVSGDVFKLECIGTAIKVYKNGSVILSATNGAVTSGQPGLGGEAASSAAAVKFDNWQGDAASAGVVAGQGYTSVPGPGISPSKRDQFKAAIRDRSPAAPVTTISGIVGTWSWAGTTGSIGISVPSGLGYVKQPGPGVGPFNNGQFISSPRGFSPLQASQVAAQVGAWSWTGTTATTSQLVNAGVGAWSWAGTTATTSQLLNATPGAWTWAGTTATTSQLLNASPGTYSWAGTTAATTQLISATVGAWSWAGTTSSLGSAILAIPGAYTWAGVDATIPTQINGSVGAYSWAGVLASIPVQVPGTVGAFSWAGTTATTTQLINASPGAWGWVGVDFTAILSQDSNAAGRPNKKKYQLVIGKQIFEGTKEEVEAESYRQAVKRRLEAATVREIIVPAKKKKPAITAITPVSKAIEASFSFDDDEDILVLLL